MTAAVPCVVIGAGQAGLAVSRHLQLLGVDHVVLEKGQIGETWASARWDSFHVNTPNWFNHLPGVTISGDPDGFASTDELLAFYREYAGAFQLPIHEGVGVTEAERDGPRFRLRTSDRSMAELRAQSVVVAAGSQRVPKVPAVASRVPSTVTQLHAGTYKSGDAIPEGPVLVVGSAQSGVQIAEDLLASGREVYLSVSRVGRAPRRYRGRDLLAWMVDMGMFARRTVDLDDPSDQYRTQPQVSGVGPRGHTVSLQGLSEAGATLVGRMGDVNRSGFRFDQSVADAVRAGDEFSAELKEAVDEHIETEGLDAPPPDVQPVDTTCDDPEALQGPSTLAAGPGGVGTVVWCTGFGGDFSWMDLGALDERGKPTHAEGASPVPGVFHMGYPWLRTARSGLIGGVDEDGATIAAGVVAHLGG